MGSVVLLTLAGPCLAHAAITRFLGVNIQRYFQESTLGKITIFCAACSNAGSTGTFDS